MHVLVNHSQRDLYCSVEATRSFAIRAVDFAVNLPTGAHPFSPTSEMAISTACSQEPPMPWQAFLP